MSSGSLIELSALGSLDQAVAQLAGKHRISPWSGTTPSSTNFAVDYNISTLQSGKQNGPAAQEMTFKLNRAGDLCHAAVLEIRLPKLAADASGAYVWAAGYKAVQSCKLVIGGQEIEKFSGRWLEMQSEITQAPGIKPLRAVNKFSSISTTELKEVGKTPEGHIVLHVPLSYYFTQSTAKALRSVALAYHDVEFRVKLCPFADIVTAVTHTNTAAVPVVDWGDCEIKLITGSVYLDAHEREETARACVEQVVCMTQALTDVDSPNGRSWGSDTDFTIDNIPFNHPTRMLVVAVAQDKRLDTSANTDNYLNRGTRAAATTSVWSDDGKDCATLPKNDFEYRLQSGTGANTVLQHSLSKIALKLNNHDRLSGDLHAGFFNTTTTAMVGYVPRSGIYVIPFSLNVRAEAGGMAVGSLNLSRVDRTSMTLTCPQQIAGKEVFLYASSYNVISVRNGMLGVRFSN